MSQQDFFLPTMTFRECVTARADANLPAATRWSSSPRGFALPCRDYM